MKKDRFALISIPKSGTHLMLHILGLDNISFHRTFFEGYLDPAGFSKASNRYRVYENECISGHILHNYSTMHIPDDYITIFLYRHPGDILVSWMHYMTHPSGFATMQGAHRSIMDYTDVKQFLIDNLIDEIKPFLGWLGEENVIKVRYEDLLQKPEEALKPIDERHHRDVLDTLVRRSRFRGGETFRKGKTGEWRKEIAGKYYDHFREYYSDIAEKMGYLI